jgi:hypothetical protein
MDHEIFKSMIASANSNTSNKNEFSIRAEINQLGNLKRGSKALPVRI